MPTSRRSFLRYASLAAASAPIFGEHAFALAAQPLIQTAAQQPVTTPANSGPSAPTKRNRPPTPAGAVLINANENPLGPCKSACEAIAAMAPMGGRYDLTGQTEQLTQTVAAQNNLQADHIAVYAGSGEPLHFTTLAFTSGTRPLITADPTFEAAERAAKFAGAKTIRVPLVPGTYAHDVKAMLTADKNPGLIYICNPNNPTGTLTTRQDILFALEHKPKGSILLVDEAYIHLSDAPSVIDQVAAGGDLIVLRTFSKIYGMAGIRCGLALGRPDLLAKLQPYGQNAMPVTSSAAANASLLDADLIPTRKKLIGETRIDTLAWLKTNNYKVIGDSQSNCFMIDTGRPGKDVIQAMQAQNVYIGRTWPIWPNAVRISVGTPAEMAAFQSAFKQVMA